MITLKRRSKSHAKTLKRRKMQNSDISVIDNGRHDITTHFNRLRRMYLNFFAFWRFCVKSATELEDLGSHCIVYRLRLCCFLFLCLCVSAISFAQQSPLPQAKSLVTFTDGRTAPFESGSAEVSHEHAPPGQLALRLNSGYAVWDGLQDWTGFDFFKTEVYNSADTPTTLSIEIQDQSTKDYWTRVNYNTVVPPGASTLIVPTDLYVGEKSRPGRALDRAHIKRFVLNIGDVKASIYFSSLRLERDLSDSVHVPGLRAFSFGPGASSPFSGFTPVTPAATYSPGRGYGFKGTPVTRTYDVLQPDPLYEKGMFIPESGCGFAVDLQNGKYHVFANIDYPSGFWGEYQVYQSRKIKANGAVVSEDRVDLDLFQKRYFRFANTEDRPEENTFDKYQVPYFHEKEFDVDVTGGLLYLEFEGDGLFANTLSAIVIFPESQAAQGRRYLANLRERRRFYFDNYFKRVLPNGNRDEKGIIPAFQPTPDEQTRGYAVFERDWMRDIPVNAVPRREEVVSEISLFASAGQEQPLVFSVFPLRSVGKVTAAVSDLRYISGATVVSSSVFRAGVVSHRLTRVTGEGSVYTISPRYIMPRDSTDVSAGSTTTFWFTMHVPDHVKAGEYRGSIRLTGANGSSETIPIRVRMFATKLDELDVPAGPWGCALGMPWNRPQDLGDYNREMYRKSLAKMREYGCTTFSGIPTVRITEWKGRRPIIDFTQGDQEMADARAAGFNSVVVNYNGGIGGFNNYEIDEPAMRAAGFASYVEFLRTILTEVDNHAHAAGWLPVAYNLCDEPIGDAAKLSAANAKAWAEAAPKDMLTTGATSVEGVKENDPQMVLATALRVPNLNGHDAASVKAIQANGGAWAFYNGGSRWTFGTYMFKCAQEYGMKFRLSWHWNVAAGDPYYALDCREDDYCWCATNANRDLIPSIHFDREIRAGLDDYRYLLTLSRLIKERPNHSSAAAARTLVSEKLGTFKLGDREHDAKWPAEEYQQYQLKLAEAIERMTQ